jgi:hypothetical protein
MAVLWTVDLTGSCSESAVGFIRTRLLHERVAGPVWHAGDAGLGLTHTDCSAKLEGGSAPRVAAFGAC